MVGALAMIAITGLILVWMTPRPNRVLPDPDHRVAAGGGAPSV
jgi:hypothetical protein